MVIGDVFFCELEGHDSTCLWEVGCERASHERGTTGCLSGQFTTQRYKDTKGLRGKGRRHRGRVLAAIQKVFALFYHNALKKNMPENLELPEDMM